MIGFDCFWWYCVRMRRILLVVFLSFLFAGCSDMDFSDLSNSEKVDVNPKVTQKILDTATYSFKTVSVGIYDYDSYLRCDPDMWLKPRGMSLESDRYVFKDYVSSGFAIVSGKAWRSSWDYQGEKIPVIICDLSNTWTRSGLMPASLFLVGNEDYSGRFYFYKLIFDGVEYSL